MSQPLLSASQIKDAVDLSFEDVLVPEWGGSVRLQQMNAAESAEFGKEMETIAGSDTGMYLMIIYSARDADGNRLFTKEDLEMLKGKSMNVLNRLQMISLRLNKMGKAEEAALKKD